MASGNAICLVTETTPARLPRRATRRCHLRWSGPPSAPLSLDPARHEAIVERLQPVKGAGETVSMARVFLR